MTAVSHTTMKITANLAYNHGENKKEELGPKTKVKSTYNLSFVVEQNPSRQREQWNRRHKRLNSRCDRSCNTWHYNKNSFPCL